MLTSTALVLMLIYPLRRPASLHHFIAFLASVVLSFFIVAAINFAVGTLAVRLKSILGLLRAKYFLLELFSGLLFADFLFPEVFQKLLSCLVPSPCWAVLSCCSSSLRIAERSARTARSVS